MDPLEALPGRLDSLGLGIRVLHRGGQQLRSGPSIREELLRTKEPEDFLIPRGHPVLDRLALLIAGECMAFLKRLCE